MNLLEQHKKDVQRLVVIVRAAAADWDLSEEDEEEAAQMRENLEYINALSEQELAQIVEDNPELIGASDDEVVTWLDSWSRIYY